MIALLSAAGGGLAGRSMVVAPAAQVIRMEAAFPQGASTAAGIAISPDGMQVVYVVFGADGFGLAAFSPDGRWIAYQAGDGGALDEVFVRPFPGPGGALQVSNGTGSMPVWELRRLNAERQ